LTGRNIDDIALKDPQNTLEETIESHLAKTKQAQDN
jgi:hypothetical protein